ncbi:Metallo-dependent phosphatase-like protein [Syncephalis fuscata]|nr:Metallo-dependent phosphatase-like protein [Syncephalis fuscata]
MTADNSWTNEHGETVLRIVHFNDVYHLDEQAKEPVGGAARFYTALQQARTFTEQVDGQAPLDNALILFSGDLFNPSIESSVTKGKHMVPVVNKLNIDVACYGNHDFDFGVANLEKLAALCNFPWLLSNVFDSSTNMPLANGKEYIIVERAGIKIGVIGLVEKEWLQTISDLPPTVEYRDYVEIGKKLANHLRSAEGGQCDIVIALTHMRLPNDQVCARELDKEVDLVLGGHDHFSHYGGAVCLTDVDGKPIKQSRPDDGGLRMLKSGCDFREISRVDVTVGKRSEGRRRINGIKAHHVEVTKSYTADEEMATLVTSLTGEINAKLSTPVGRTLTAWDARSTTVRIKESNIGNLAADLMRLHWDGTDIGLLCGGTIRSDSTYGPGVLSKRDLMNIFPFEDPSVLIRISGKTLLATFESALGAVPKQEGRFPHVSGCRVVYEPTAPAGSHPTLARPGEVELDLDHMYKVCTRYYLACGNDGYEPLKGCEFLVDDENGILISTLLRKFFLGLKYVNAIKFQERAVGGRVNEAVNAFKAGLVRRRTREQELQSSTEGVPETDMKDALTGFQRAKRQSSSTVLDDCGVPQDDRKNTVINWATVAPVVEGRIVAVDAQGKHIAETHE